MASNIYEWYQSHTETGLVKNGRLTGSSKFSVLEIYSRKHSFTGREANPNFQTQTVDGYHQTCHRYNGLKSHHHLSFSKLELGMCQLWVRLICLSSQSYFRPTHQGHPRSQRAFCEHLIPITQLHFGYTIHILFLFYNWSFIIFSNHSIAHKIGVTAVPVIR